MVAHREWGHSASSHPDIQLTLLLVLVLSFGVSVQEEFEAMRPSTSPGRKIGVPNLNNKNFPDMGAAKEIAESPNAAGVAIKGAHPQEGESASRLRPEAQHFYGVPAKEVDTADAKPHKSKYGPNAVEEDPVRLSCVFLLHCVFAPRLL
jgi:hypothetical protein